jgi:hypothetical protein
MTGLFGRGCLKKVKRIELPMVTMVISSRFHYKMQGFIQAELPKDGKAMYFSPPPGHVEEPDVVYQVLKPLYGMPHSGRCLHVTWSNWLVSQGFQKAGYEGAMWSRKDKDGDTILVATHVDNSIVTGSYDDKTDTFVREMLDRFDGTCKSNLTEMRQPTRQR